MSVPRRQLSDPEPLAAAAVVLVRPAAFAANPQTFDSNGFQSRDHARLDLRQAARDECDGLAAALRGAGVAVTVLEDPAEPAKPDAVFPNNWFSTHHDGTLVLYPMCAPNRRLERRADLADALRAAGHRVARTIDLSEEERAGRYLEGTGSLVLDRAAKVAYACRSPRTDPAVLARWADALGYRTLLFDAFDAQGQACYHTNVLMCVGHGWAVLCAEAIREAAQRDAVRDALLAGGHELVEIDHEQMSRFAGNMLELRADRGPLVACSTTARDALRPEQRAAIERHARLVAVPVPTIEAAGGGSVRCMIAENFLPRTPERTR